MSWIETHRFDSHDSHVSKYVFTAPDAVAEAVLYRYDNPLVRTVICISTQSGCPVGCTFCGTGNRFIRSLTAEEIWSQVHTCLADAGISGPRVEKFQIMFMSMGEPLLNMKATGGAIGVLHTDFPNAQLLISTSAPKVSYEPLFALSQRVPSVGLQFSVHESTDERRNKLIPFAAKLSLAEIADMGHAWYMATGGRKPFFNYCVHPENNNSADADRLRGLFRPSVWNATLSVICEKDESVAMANERQHKMASDFADLLQERGFDTRVFDPAGQDDIGGGCGQLWFVQKWMSEHV